MSKLEDGKATVDIEAVFSAFDEYRYLELEQSLPFLMRSSSGPRFAAFSYSLRDEDGNVTAFISEALLLSACTEEAGAGIERIPLNIKLPARVPSDMGELDEEDYARELATLPTDTPWNQMKKLIAQVEPEELIPLYEAVHNSLA